jgi:hypothetical protein
MQRCIYACFNGYVIAVGVIIGFIFGKSTNSFRLWSLLTAKGSVNIMRYGAGPNGVMRTLGNTMLGSGAAFGSVEYGSSLS